MDKQIYGFKNFIVKYKMDLYLKKKNKTVNFLKIDISYFLTLPDLTPIDIKLWMFQGIEYEYSRKCDYNILQVEIPYPRVLKYAPPQGPLSPGARCILNFKIPLPWIPQGSWIKNPSSPPGDGRYVVWMFHFYHSTLKSLFVHSYTLQKQNGLS